MKDIQPLAKPFTLNGDRSIYCLLIHGFTASPSEMRLLAQILNHNGYTVHAPLLPGHGTTPEDLAQTNYNDWYRAVGEQTEEILSLRPRKLVVIGLSMGALLALQLGARVKGIDGLVCINTPILIRDQRAKWARLVKVFRNYVPKNMNDHDLLLEAKGRFSYNRIPIKAFLSMRKLARDTLTILDKINKPVLIVQSQKDETVNPKSAEILQRQLRQDCGQILWLPDSHHVATMDEDLTLLGNGIINFVDHIINRGDGRG